MFPINFNFPYRKKDGSLITMEKAIDGAGADLDLIDLDDVAITNPANGDGLIYDNTTQKWENVPIMTEGVLKVDYVTLTSYNITAGNSYDYALPSTYDGKKVIAISPVSVGPTGWGSAVPAVFSGINLTSKLVTVRAYVTGDYSPKVLVFYRDV